MQGVGNSIRLCVAVAACLAFVVGVPAIAAAAVDDETVLIRLERLEKRQAELESELAARDARIRELERQAAAGAVAAAGTMPPPAPVAAAASGAPSDAQHAAMAEPGHHGRFQPEGGGFRLVDAPNGELGFNAWAYVRYLNQEGLDTTYTDAFGRTTTLDIRNDVQVNKVNLYFNGWVFDPRFHFNFWTWTTNTAQGEPAQIVLAGDLGYRFSDKFDLRFGVLPLPGTRSLRGQHPRWNKVDHRTIGNEFFRPSFTTGIIANGQLAEGLHYRAAIANNMSALGVSAAQLDDEFNTVAAGIWWMPTTGEYGTGTGYGDFDYHEELATQFGLSVSRSRESRQNQPGTEDPENTQLRLSDGTLLFRPDAFGTGGTIEKATYRMLAADAGFKYRGVEVAGEAYFRWIDDFVHTGPIPVAELYDYGFELQASAMLLPETLGAYVAGSKIYGEYGEPWDLGVGVNWYPFGEQLIRVNAEMLYLEDSPVGYSSVPFAVGGNGWVFQTNFESRF
ncbi:MAG TPA: hypothetical protein VFY03_03835 [Woeseiaceae bacterium]|nr:hypothetical protein [Woeseiaceae bacterium]